MYHIRFITCTGVAALVLCFVSGVVDAQTPTTPTMAAPPAHCVYNKTRQQSVAVSSERSTITLQAGTHFCCKSNDALCGAQASANWRVEAMLEGKSIWCGDASKPVASRPNIITLPGSDSYLLVRDFREAGATTNPPATGALPKGQTPPSTAAAKRAPLSVDLMAADGRVLTTLPCQFAG